jgi:hypothetical protein
MAGLPFQRVGSNDLPESIPSGNWDSRPGGVHFACLSNQVKKQNHHSGQLPATYPGKLLKNLPVNP